MKTNDETDAFNEAHPIGTKVRYWPGFRGKGNAYSRESVTRTKAWVVGATPCVSVDGFAGGIALSHVEVLDD